MAIKRPKLLKGKTRKRNPMTLQQAAEILKKYGIGPRGKKPIRRGRRI